MEVVEDGTIKKSKYLEEESGESSISEGSNNEINKRKLIKKPRRGCRPTSTSLRKSINHDN